MLLEVKNLKTYFTVDSESSAKAVDNVSFGMEAGKTLALVGESGCGKSQTAFSIIRLLESNGYHPAESEIVFDGEDLLAKSEEEMQQIRGNKIAMIFQEPMTSLNPLYRVSSQLSEPLMLHQGMKKKEAYGRCIELLQHVGIPAPKSRVDNYPHEMSGGMKQRVMIAMALACRPSLLIADEPTTALDVTIEAQILGLMKELQQETGMAILFITHDLAVVNQMADDVCVMYAGKVAEFGNREDIFGNMQHPYTRRLLESIPSGANINYKLHTIPGHVPDAADYRACGCRFYDRCVEHLAKCEAIDPPLFACHGSERHFAHCHLLDPEFDGDRSAAAQKIQRPQKKKPDEQLIKARNLQTHFPVKKGLLQRVVNYVKAVDDVDIEIRRGETLALVGESGCGKTTVGLSILRLLDEARGEIRFVDENILEMPRKKVKQMRKHMQIVFQDPVGSLSPRMKVGDIIGEGLKVHAPDMKAAQRREMVGEVLDLVGMSPSLVDRFPHEFSGGQRQRIAIARALILDPEFLVLDEPTSALDVSVQAQILNLLEDIQLKRGLAYLFITHDLGVVEYIADQVAVMYLGRIVEHATTAELFKNSRHPYTKTLFDAVPRIGEDRRGFARIGGDVPSPLDPPSGCHFHPRCPIAVERCRQDYPELRTLDGTRVACHRAGENESEPER